MEIVTARGAGTIRQALDAMPEHCIGYPPAVDGERLVGLLSETDRLCLLRRLLSAAASPDGAGVS